MSYRVLILVVYTAVFGFLRPLTVILAIIGYWAHAAQAKAFALLVAYSGIY
jgi:hypothetical protein